MKKYFSKGISTIICAAFLLSLMTACGSSRVSMSKSLYVINETDVTLVSLLLTAENPSLDEPIEVLDGALAPGDIQEVVISLPEKQAKKSEWTVLPITEEGESNSRPFTFGELNPHADTPLQGFYVQWFEGNGGHYGAGVTSAPLEDYLPPDDSSDTGEEDIESKAEQNLSNEDSAGPLALNEKYLTEGSIAYGYITFYDDTTCFMLTATDEEVHGYYTVDGWQINCSLDNGEQQFDIVFNILDEDTFELPNGEYTPTKFIREDSL